MNDDDVVECTEVFDVIISPRSWCGLASGNNAQVIIINDDGKVVVCFLLCENPYIRRVMFNVQWRFCLLGLVKCYLIVSSVVGC